MSATPISSTDPVSIVQQLDAEAIRARIDALDRERAALLVLLRAALRIRRDTAAGETEKRAIRPPAEGVARG